MRLEDIVGRRTKGLVEALLIGKSCLAGEFGSFEGETRERRGDEVIVTERFTGDRADGLVLGGDGLRDSVFFYTGLGGTFYYFF